MPHQQESRRSSVRRNVISMALLCLAACTTMRDDGRRTATWLDEHATPSDSTTRAVLLPLAIPAGLVALAVDTAIVNPVCAVDDAWADTDQVLWDRGEETAMRRALFTPLAALATPVVFVCDWAWRCIFPCDPNPGRSEPEVEATS